MLRCEINKNIASQLVEIYLFDEKNYYGYREDHGFQIHPRESIYTLAEPFISIPYEAWDVMKEAFKKELDVEKIEGSSAHIKDLRWILGHFLNKDK